MDPITTAILAAIPAVASDIASSVVKDAYAGLKSIIARKFGPTSAVAKSVDDLEANPRSKGQALVLSERVAETNAVADADIMEAVNKLVEALSKARFEPPNVHVEATMAGGVAGVVGAQNVSIGTFHQGAQSAKDRG